MAVRKNPVTGTTMLMPLGSPTTDYITPNTPITPPPPARPPAGPAAPVTYKSWLAQDPTRGPSNLRNALLWWNQYGKAQGAVKPGSTPSPATAAPGATAPSVAQPSATPAPSVSPADAVTGAPTTDISQAIGAVGSAPQVDTSHATLPLPTKYPTLDVNTLYGPAQRSIDQQRAALVASQARQQSDNQAFAAYINGLTAKSSTALGGTLTDLGNQANAARTASMSNVNDLVSQALQGAGQGAGNADLQRLSGLAAQGQSDTALQAGQSAQNAMPSEIAQANLQRSGVDQGNIDKASDRLMQLEGGRQYNTALAGIGQQQSGLDQAAAQLGAQDVMSTRQYMSDAATRNLMAAQANATLASKTQGYNADVIKSWVTATGKMNVAQINGYVKKLVADGTVAAKDRATVAQTLIGARHDRASVEGAAIRSNATGTNKQQQYLSQGTSLLSSFNQNEDTLHGPYANLNRAAQGHRAEVGLARLAGQLGKVLSPADALKILSSQFPGDVLRDPNYVNEVQRKFTGA